jgi:hypothetical protein
VETEAVKATSKVVEKCTKDESCTTSIITKGTRYCDVTTGKWKNVCFAQSCIAGYTTEKGMCKVNKATNAPKQEEPVAGDKCETADGKDGSYRLVNQNDTLIMCSGFR